MNQAAIETNPVSNELAGINSSLGSNLNTTQSFIDQWWPVPPPFAKYQELEFGLLEGTVLHEEAQPRYDALLPELQTLVVNSVGEKIWAQFCRMLERFQSLNPESAEGERLTAKINEFVFNHDLQLLNPIDTFFRARKALELLIPQINELQTPRTLVDLGCGDGRISLGLLQACSQIQQLIAVDASPGALGAFERMVNRLSDLPNSVVNKPIDMVSGDYNRGKTHDKITQSKGTDQFLYLAAFTPDHSKLMKSLDRLLTPGDSALICFPHGIESDVYIHSAVHDMIDEYIQQMMSREAPKFSFAVSQIAPFISLAVVAVVEARKRP